MADREQLLQMCRKIRSAGLKERTATYMDKRVQYFRRPGFVNLLVEKKMFQELQTKQQIVEFAEKLIEQNLIIKTVGRLKEGQKRPNMLFRTVSQSFDTEGFYLWHQDVAKTKWNWFLSVFIILGVISACCFSIWPLWAKLGLWYLSVVLLVVLVGIMIIRLLVFLLLFPLGYDFWIMPNLMDDRIGFWKSFFPLWFNHKRQDDGVIMWILRVLDVILIIAAPYLIMKFPEMMEELQNLGVQGVWDLVAWGEDRLTRNSTDIQMNNQYNRYIYDPLIEDDDL